MAPPDTEEQLEDFLSRPWPEDVDFARQLEGDVLVLGVGGKMGLTLVRRVLRAFEAAGVRRAVYAVSRFSEAAQREKLEDWGARTIKADLFEEDRLNALPNCPNVVYMIGSKFGTVGNEAATWATNAFLAGRMAERFKSSRLAVFSTGNVYPLVPVDSGGSKETDTPAPIGEYGQSCLGRERVLEHFSRRYGTPMCILRLNYAVEPRYGVLCDIAEKVESGRAIPLAMGYVNVIWQGDANSAAFRSLGLCESPPSVLNVTGSETLSVRHVAEELAQRLERQPVFAGSEADRALLSDSRRCRRLLGVPRFKLDEMLDLITHWIKIGGPCLGKPTRFEVMDGQF